MLNLGDGENQTNFFFLGCCAWMLLFAYIMFVLATAPALKVAGVTAMSVVSI